MSCLNCIHRIGNETTREIWYNRDGYSFKLKPGEHYCKKGYFNSRKPRRIPANRLRSFADWCPERGVPR